MHTHTNDVLEWLVMLGRALSKTGAFDPKRPSLDRAHFRLHRDLSRLLRSFPEIALVPAPSSNEGTRRELQIDGTAPTREVLRRIMPEDMGGTFALRLLELLDDRGIAQLAFRKPITREDLDAFLDLAVSSADGEAMDEALAGRAGGVVVVSQRHLPEGEIPWATRLALARLAHDVCRRPAAELRAELAADAARPFVRVRDALVSLLAHAPIIDPRLASVRSLQNVRARELVLSGLPLWSVLLVHRGLAGAELSVDLEDGLREPLLRDIAERVAREPTSVDRDRALRDLLGRGAIALARLPGDLREIIEAEQWVDALAVNPGAPGPPSPRTSEKGVRHAVATHRYVAATGALRWLRGVDPGGVARVFDASLIEAIADGMPAEHDRRVESTAFVLEGGPAIVHGLAEMVAHPESKPGERAAKILAALGEKGAAAARDVLEPGVTSETGATMLLNLLRLHAQKSDVPMLVRYTFHRAASVRRGSLMALITVDRDEAALHVVKAFADRDTSVRILALNICARSGLGLEQILPGALDLILKDAAHTEADIVCAAIEVVSKTAARGAMSTDEAVDAFCRLVAPPGLVGRLIGRDRPATAVLAAAIGALTGFATPRAQSTLDELAKGKDPEIARIAATARGRQQQGKSVMPPAPSVMPPQNAAAPSSDPTERTDSLPTLPPLDSVRPAPASVMPPPNAAAPSSFLATSPDSLPTLPPLDSVRPLPASTVPPAPPVMRLRPSVLAAPLPRSDSVAPPPSEAPAPRAAAVVRRAPSIRTAAPRRAPSRRRIDAVARVAERANDTVVPDSERTPGGGASTTTRPLERLPSRRSVSRGEVAFDAPWRSVIEWNAELELDRALQTLRDTKDRAKISAFASRAAAVLVEAIALAPPTALYAIDKALSRLDSRPADDALQKAAHDMITMAFFALCGDDDAREAVGKMSVFLQGEQEPEPGTFAIRQVARAVCDCLALLQERHDAQGAALAFLATVDPLTRERLEEDQVSRWLESYAPQRARDKLTLIGIVANIVWYGEVLGVTENHTQEYVTRRVEEALRPRGLFKRRL